MRAPRRSLGARLGSYGCGAVLACGLTAAELGACGSSSDLVIGRNGPTVAQAGQSGVTLDASVDAETDAGLDASLECHDGAFAACSGEDASTSAAAIVHRYSFTGTGALAVDSVGGADGQLEPGASLDGTGRLVLDGVNGYVALPSHLISVLDGVTFVSWATFEGGSGYERIFDFGASDGTTGRGESYVALSPYGGKSQLLLLVRQSSTLAEIQVPSCARIDDSLEHQTAVVLASNSRAELYLDGELLGRTSVTISLSQITDVNDWLGRSQWTQDHFFHGSIDEFRIYDRALTPCEIQALNQAGPGQL